MPQMDKFAFLSEYFGVFLSLIVLYIILVIVFLPKLKSRIILNIWVKIRDLKNYILIEKLNFFKNQKHKFNLLKSIWILK